METSRPPHALCDWVDAKTSLLSETEEGKRYARSGELLPKKLWEEIRPLGLFARCHYGLRGGIKCTPNLGNDNFDGKIDFDNAATPTIYVEITYAIDGYDESLRLELLTEKGSVNALGKISTTGTKASGRRISEVENEAVRHEDTLNNALEILKKRIFGKSGKVYGSSHVLVVVVDDYLPFRTEDDRAVLERFSKDIIEGTTLDFKAVFLLGSTGNYLSCVYGEA